MIRKWPPQGQRQVFELGPRRTQATFEKSQSGTCVPSSATIMPLGIEVDPARLVELVPTKLPTSP